MEKRTQWVMIWGVVGTIFGGSAVLWWVTAAPKTSNLDRWPALLLALVGIAGLYCMFAAALDFWPYRELGPESPEDARTDVDSLGVAHKALIRGDKAGARPILARLLAALGMADRTRLKQTPTKQPGDAATNDKDATEAEATDGARANVVHGDTRTARLHHEQPPDAEQRATSERRPRSIGSVVGALVCAGFLAGVVVVAFLLATSRGAHASTFRSRGLVLTVDSHWHTVKPTQPWLSLRSPIAIANGMTEIYVGTTSAHAPVATEIPRTLRSQYGAPESVSQLINLRLGRARRYLWPNPSGHPPLALVVVATSDGEVAIACSTSSSTTFNRTLAVCMGVLSKAQILGTQVEYPGPDPTVAKKLSNALKPRASIDPRTFAALGANRLQSRTGALTRIARADEDSATALAAISTTPRYATPIAALARALKHEAAIADEVAAAAQHDQSTRYTSLRRQYSSVDSQVTLRKQYLTDLGFMLPQLRQISLPPLPPRAQLITQSHEIPTAAAPYIPSEAVLEPSKHEVQPPQERDIPFETKSK
jgi:hypothetical protein